MLHKLRYRINGACHPQIITFSKSTFLERCGARDSESCVVWKDLIQICRAHRQAFLESSAGSCSPRKEFEKGITQVDCVVCSVHCSRVVLWLQHVYIQWIMTLSWGIISISVGCVIGAYGVGDIRYILNLSTAILFSGLRYTATLIAHLFS